MDCDYLLTTSGGNTTKVMSCGFYCKLHILSKSERFKHRLNVHRVEARYSLNSLRELILGCIECARCRLLSLMFAVSVSLRVCPSVCHSVCHAGSFGEAFAKSPWPLADSPNRIVVLVGLYEMRFTNACWWRGPCKQGSFGGHTSLATPSPSSWIRPRYWNTSLSDQTLQDYRLRLPSGCRAVTPWCWEWSGADSNGWLYDNSSSTVHSQPCLRTHIEAGKFSLQRRSTSVASSY